ncbi:hypothetical protein BpHYR1_045900 [Brachionus plicatilis]|uniref:Chitin-binding type-2 domain-containing protein n=1 Tax=Brachionus plicatilis TaxID=10195 RepID=A0A3M7S7L3_BRAPC|nr:hypothetical protein BpHYR1_045900 [Brachionus plicatilis]
MYNKALAILVIISNVSFDCVVCTKKNYLRGIDIFRMLENSEQRLAPKLSKYSCSNRQDEGHYVHKDCRKYWHCLYVGTVFEEALERKCPAGTMFHPIQRTCEMSPMLNCLIWYQYIYGKDSIPNYLFTGEDSNSYTTSSFEKKIIDTSRELNELLITFKQPSKTRPNYNSYYDDYYYSEYPEPSGSYKIQINTTQPLSSTKMSAKAGSKFTTLFSSNLLEKLRNFKSEKSEKLNEKNSSKVKNFTILSSNGKKTLVAEDEVSPHHNLSNNQRILSTKSIQPVQIIKNIFALSNRSNFEKNYLPNLSYRLFITEKMYAKTPRTLTTNADQVWSYYEDVEAAEAEEVEYMDNELMEVSDTYGQDLLLNLQLNIDNEKKPAHFEDYSEENAENFLLAEETVSEFFFPLNVKFSFHLKKRNKIFNLRPFKFSTLCNVSRPNAIKNLQ